LHLPLLLPAVSAAIGERNPALALKVNTNGIQVRAAYVHHTL
jgi:hypothetical protein